VPAVLDPPRTVPADDLTRREVVLAGAALALGIGLAGCGGDDGAAPDRSGGSDTVVVTNKYGTFDVPRNPQRVVGWEGRRDLETAVALDLPLAAVGSNALMDGEFPPFIPFDPTGVEVLEQAEPSLELIASLRPDLILTRESNIDELADKLRPIAPLVPVQPDGPWRPDLESVGTALERTERLAEVLAGYDEARAEVRARHARRIDSAVLAVVQYATGVGFYSSSTDGFYLQANTLADVGGNHLPFLEEGTDEFSIEQIPRLADADAILLITNEAAERAEIEANTLWSRLPAVRAGRVVHTDFRTNYGSVYAATACLDLLDRTYGTLA
jgi:iron complex transport system substrate-binding protein